MDWLLCLAVGTCAGTIGSMLGTGSGFILIPGLTLALGLMGFSGPDLFKIAIATTHGANIFTALAAFQAHAARRNIDWTAFFRLCPGIMLGAMAGAVLGTKLDASLMAAIFIAFAVVIASRMVRTPARQDDAKPPLATALALSLRGLGIGILAAITGAGGLTTPLLAKYLPIRRAIGTSAAITLPIVVPAALSYYAVAVRPVACSSDCLGLIFLPGVFAAGIASVLAAPFGTWLSHVLPIVVLRRVFACLLLLVATKLAWTHGTAFMEAAAAAGAIFQAEEASQVSGALPPAWLSRSILPKP